MQKIPLSVTIIAKNEADRIAKPITSVIDWADEVIVVDSGSTDDTVKLAESLGASVVYNPWRGFGHQKKFAATLCRNDWVLNLDADEEVSPELREEIIAMFSAPRAHSAYWVKVCMVLPHEEKPRRFGNFVTSKRLYDRQKAASATENAFYDEVRVSEGSVGKLAGVMHHRSFRSLEHEVDKINRYTSIQAADKGGRRIPVIRIVLEPFGAFLKAYFLKRYCVYGVEGFVQGVMYAFARTLRLAKIRELNQENALKNRQ